MTKKESDEFRTGHTVLFQNAGAMGSVADESVDLVVTSPPYPMIAMWDDLFVRADPEVQKVLGGENGPRAFEAMHRALEPVWREVFRVLRPGGFACINIGDAVRTIGGDFRLYANHVRILARLVEAGFGPLPAILWRKQTNAPNKFMGSGMLPAGAYVTLEHEYVLICRKGSKREFKTPDEKQNRQESAIFWEERNQWFSDVWMDLKGSRQSLNGKEKRKRSGAFPFELAYRLINMYSVRGDTVLDPFLGTGTTMLAAMAAGRNSIGLEIDPSLAPAIRDAAKKIIPFSNHRMADRLADHRLFVQERMDAGKPIKHTNLAYGFPVVTSQEINLVFHPLRQIEKTGKDSFEVVYEAGCGKKKLDFATSKPQAPASHKPPKASKRGQLKLNF